MVSPLGLLILVAVWGGGCAEDFPWEGNAEASVYGKVSHEVDEVMGIQVEGVAYERGCDGWRRMGPVTSEADQEGHYRLQLMGIARAPCHACVRVTAKHVESGKSSEVFVDDVRFVINPPYDSVRVDVALD